jgi:RHS repeat-associated protein
LLLLKNATGAVTEEYGYNPRGNLAQIRASGSVTRTFQWDGADRMAGATAGGNTLAMKYDVDGRRVNLKTVGGTNGETNYLWDTTTRYGDVLIESDQNGNITTRYSYGYACGSCNASPLAELLAQKKGAVTNPREYYLLDGQGSVRGLTDGTNGTLTQEYAYDTFGKLTSGDATKSAYLYTGQQYDAATELYSLRARYYSPQQGRFLSMDKWPVNYRNPIELNRYGYTANNPTNWSDPSGNATFKEYSDLSPVQKIIYRANIAAFTFVSSAVIVPIIFLVFAHIILFESEKRECTALFPSVCVYYLNNDGTKRFAILLRTHANLVQFFASNWGTGIGLALGVLTPDKGKLGTGLTLAGIAFAAFTLAMSLQDTKSLIDGANTLEAIANSNSGTGRAKVAVIGLRDFQYQAW